MLGLNFMVVSAEIGSNAAETSGGGASSLGLVAPLSDTPPPSLADRNAPRCGYCGRTDSPDNGICLLECSGCLNIYYCSKQHQLADWRRHKPDCRASQLKPRVILHPEPASSVKISASSASISAPPTSILAPSTSISAPSTSISAPMEASTSTISTAGDRPSVIKMAGKGGDPEVSSAAQNHARAAAQKRPTTVVNYKAECLSLTTIPERRATFGMADLAGLYRQNKQQHQQHQQQMAPSSAGAATAAALQSAQNFIDPNPFSNLAHQFSNLASPEIQLLNNNNNNNNNTNNRRMGMAPEFATKMVLSESTGPKKFDHSSNPRINLLTDERFKSSPSSNNSPSPASVSHKRDLKINKIAHCASVMLQRYGWAVFDNFLGTTHAQRVHEEVQELYETPGKFADGQLVKTKEGSSTLDVRSDKIYWFDNWLDQRVTIGFLVSMIDSVVGKMRDFPYTIAGRCKPMIACYPGSGSKYVQHVDNPDKDGRLITAIYYLNANWTQETGGILRLLPTSALEPVDIEPIFDRLIFFWSDKRNPHEVLPSFGMRYAITIWYFEKEERARFYKAMGHNNHNHNCTNSQSPHTEFTPTNSIFHSSTLGGSVDQLNQSSSFFLNQHSSPNQLTPESNFAGGASNSSNWGPAGGSRVPSLRDLSQHRDNEICINLHNGAQNGPHSQFFGAQHGGGCLDTSQLLREAADQLALGLGVVDDDPQDCPGRRNTLDLGHFQRRANSRGVYHGLASQNGGSRAPYYFGRKSMATVPESRSPENEPA